MTPHGLHVALGIAPFTSLVRCRGLIGRVRRDGVVNLLLISDPGPPARTPWSKKLKSKYRIGARNSTFRKPNSATHRLNWPKFVICGLSGPRRSDAALAGIES